MIENERLVQDVSLTIASQRTVAVLSYYVYMSQLVIDLCLDRRNVISRDLRLAAHIAFYLSEVWEIMKDNQELKKLVTLPSSN